MVTQDPGGVRLGPRSVGYLLTSQALVFGGTMPTLTDSAVAACSADLGTPDSPAVPAAARRGAGPRRHDAHRSDRPGQDVQGGPRAGRGRRRQHPGPRPHPRRQRVIRPDHSDTANAVGAAIASASGQVDQIFHLGPEGRQAALDEARNEASEHAVAAGADPATVTIVELEEIPLAYLTSPSVRIRAKAAGSLGGMDHHQLSAGPANQRRPAALARSAAT